MIYSPRKMAAALGVLLGILFAGLSSAQAADDAAKTYVILWFDTEDYILPASDDAALRVAEFLTGENIRATFKVVGEKARTLERRGRRDVIAALNQHEIGYHSNFHSVQPTPAMFLANLGWDEGVAAFDRRERPGFDDVQRIFGQTPSCYGQPGSSWGPQVCGALQKWGVEIYLDAGRHVGLDDRPCYYGGMITFYKLAHMLRAELEQPGKLQEAERRFLAASQQLAAEGGGVVSIMYHPCEFVHQEFWDGVNFRNGANPPRELWKLPPTKSPEESRIAYQVFEDYIRFIERVPEVRFVTATEAAKLYRDTARERKFTTRELRAIAAGVDEAVTFQKRADYALAASEVFGLLNAFVAERVAGRDVDSVAWQGTPWGPASRAPPLAESVTTDASQFSRTVLDVADQLRTHGRVPTAVWLGSAAVPPEAYLPALAQVSVDLLDGKPMPATIEMKPARLAAADYVSADVPDLWGWVIFPPGFRAPAMMELAKRQAWTLKPAILQRSEN